MGLVSEKQVGFLLGVGGVGQDGVMAGGMEAEDDFGAGWLFEAEAFGANGDAAIVADFDLGADAPDIRPPRTDRRGAQHGTLGFQVPPPTPAAASGAVPDALPWRCDGGAARRCVDWPPRVR